MYMRCGYFVGRPVVGKEAQFKAEMQAALPLYMQMPNIISASLLMSEEVEEGAPGIYATLQMQFASPADLEDAMRSTVRHSLRQHFVEVVFPMFEGEIKHINHSQALVRKGD